MTRPVSAPPVSVVILPPADPPPPEVARLLRAWGVGDRRALHRLAARAGRICRRLARLDQALDALAEIDPRKVRIVELRLFSGLGIEETAAALGLSTQRVLRDWRIGRAWLIRTLAAPAREAATAPPPPDSPGVCAPAPPPASARRPPSRP